MTLWRTADSLEAFFRLGAECWGPRIAKPELALKLAEEDPVKKAKRLMIEAEMSAKALKKQMALCRIARRAKYVDLRRSQQEARKNKKKKQGKPNN